MSKKPTKRELLAALRRITAFLDGICILDGPQAAAFGIQQRHEVNRASKIIRRTKGKV